MDFKINKKVVWIILLTTGIITIYAMQPYIEIDVVRLQANNQYAKSKNSGNKSMPQNDIKNNEEIHDENVARHNTAADLLQSTTKRSELRKIESVEKKITDIKVKTFDKHSRTTIVDDEKFLVFTCTNSCGGLADRQRGIVSAYLFAMLLNRTFGIDLEQPCRIETILPPNTYNWTTFRYALAEMGLTSKNATKIRPPQVFSYLKNDTKDDANLTTLMTQRVLYITTNFLLWINRIRTSAKSHNVMPWLRNTTNNAVIKIVLDVLFKSNPRVEKDVMQFRETYKVGDRVLVCAHIRTGKNPSIPGDNVIKFKGNGSVTFDFLDRFNNSDKYAIYIASDSDQLKNESATRFKNVLLVDREIVHIDRVHKTVNGACEGFNTAVFEQTVLSTCDILVASNSGFSVIAALLRGRSDNLYIYKHVKHTIESANFTRPFLEEAN